MCAAERKNRVVAGISVLCAVVLPGVTRYFCSSYSFMPNANSNFSPPWMKPEDRPTNLVCGRAKPRQIRASVYVRSCILRELQNNEL